MLLREDRRLHRVYLSQPQVREVFDRALAAPSEAEAIRVLATALVDAHEPAQQWIG